MIAHVRRAFRGSGSTRPSRTDTSGRCSLPPPTRECARIRRAARDVTAPGNGAGDSVLRRARRRPHRVRDGRRGIPARQDAKGWARRELPPDELARRQAMLTLVKQGWGQDNPAYRQLFTSLFMPEGTLEQMRWFNDLQRVSTSPENAARLQVEFGRIDVLHLLSQVAAPTLVLHARGDDVVPFEAGREVAAAIRGARFVPQPARATSSARSSPAASQRIRPSVITGRRRCGRRWKPFKRASGPRPAGHAGQPADYRGADRAPNASRTSSRVWE